MQLDHVQQLLFMQQNELESEATLVKNLCSTLKKYHFLLQGHNLTTEAMETGYEVSSCSFEMSCIHVILEVLTSVLTFSLRSYFLELPFKSR